MFAHALSPLSAIWRTDKIRLRLDIIHRLLDIRRPVLYIIFGTVLPSNAIFKIDIKVIYLKFSNSLITTLLSISNITIFRFSMFKAGLEGIMLVF